MKSRNRRSFAAAARAFQQVQAEVSADFAEADRSRLRLDLLAYLGALLTEFQRTLDAYREEMQAQSRGPSPPWLLPDPPMMGLREYRLKMFDMRHSKAGVEANTENLARERQALADGSGPGCELGDACDDMAWFLDKYLYAEILAESCRAPALPVESRLDLVDEAARGAGARSKTKPDAGSHEALRVRQSRRHRGTLAPDQIHLTAAQENRWSP